MNLAIAAALLLTILYGITSAAYFLLRKSGNQKSNLALSGLFFFFSVSLFNVLLGHAGFYNHRPDRWFLPLWFTLSLGPFLFYHVKIVLYPSYSPRLSDLKHALVPLAQAGFYLWAGFRSESYKEWVWLHVFAPWYKSLEAGLFLLSIFGYLFLAFRYVKYRRATLRKHGLAWEMRKVEHLEMLCKVLLVLAAGNAFYLTADFLAYQVLQVSFFNVEAYAWLGDLSFAAMLGWLVYYGYRSSWSHTLRTWLSHTPKVELTEETRKLFQQKLETCMETEQLYRDPDFRPVYLGRCVGLDASTTRAYVRSIFQTGFGTWVKGYRLREAHRRLQDPKYKNHSVWSIGYAAGFPSRSTFWFSYRKAYGEGPKLRIAKEL